MSERVLVVDDDMRNIFALNTVLERYGMKVAFAENAKEGISLLERDPAVELVLMDVMMPEMDGPTLLREMRRTRPDLGEIGGNRSLATWP